MVLPLKLHIGIKKNSKIEITTGNEIKKKVQIDCFPKKGEMSIDQNNTNTQSHTDMVIKHADAEPQGIARPKKLKKREKVRERREREREMDLYGAKSSKDDYGVDLEAGDLLYPGIGYGENQLRWGFIRKVYGILTAQIVLTTLVSALIVLYDPINQLLRGSSFLLLFLCFLPFVREFIFHTPPPPAVNYSKN